MPRAEQVSPDPQPPLPMESQPGYVLLSALVVEAGLGFLALSLGAVLGLQLGLTVRWSLAAVGGGVLAAVPIVLVLLTAARLPWQPFVDLVGMVDKLIVPLFRRSGTLDMVLISAMAGLSEELLFRGVVQRLTSAWMSGVMGDWTALLVASLAFGLSHSLTLTYTLLATVMGLYLGWLWLVTGNLLVPITAHAVYDAVALIYLVRIRKLGE